MNGFRWLGLLALGLMALAAHAADRHATKLDFERYVIKDHRCAEQAEVPFKCLELPSDTTNVRNRRYSFTMAPGSNYAVDVLPDEDKGKVLMLGMLPYTDGCTRKTKACATHQKDKIEFWAVHPTNDNGMDVRSSEPRFFSFDFKLDPGYEVGKRMVLHVQARQEIPHSPPPFTIYVQPIDDRKTRSVDAPVDLLFVVRDDKDRDGYDESRPGKPFFDYGRVIHTQRVTRNRWYTMTLQLQPAYNGSGATGRVAMWLDGDKQFDFTGDWGYTPTANPKSSQIGIALDVYRAPFQTTTQKIYFANVNYATTYEEAVANGH